MTIRKILQHPHPHLQRRAKLVELRTWPQRTAARELVQDLIDTMRDARGLGLAAPQIGSSAALFVVSPEAAGIKPKVFVNPRILRTEGRAVQQEGCLSVVGKRVPVARAEKVQIQAFDARNRLFEITAKGLYACVILHEFDHLEGRTIAEGGDTWRWRDVVWARAWARKWLTTPLQPRMVCGAWQRDGLTEQVVVVDVEGDMFFGDDVFLNLELLRALERVEERRIARCGR